MLELFDQGFGTSTKTRNLVETISKHDISDGEDMIRFPGQKSAEKKKGVTVSNNS